MTIYYYEIPAQIRKTAGLKAKLETYPNEESFIKEHEAAGIPHQLVMKTGKEWLTLLSKDAGQTTEQLREQAFINLTKGPEGSSKETRDLKETMGLNLLKATTEEMITMAIARNGPDAPVWVTKRTKEAHPQVWDARPPLRAIIASNSQTLSDGGCVRGILNGDAAARNFVSERLQGKGLERDGVLWREQESVQEHRGKQQIAQRLQGMFQAKDRTEGKSRGADVRLARA